MNPVVKLTGFAALLGVVFAGAALAGSLVDPHPGKGSTGTAATAMHGMGGADGAERAAPVRGLAISEGGLTLRLGRTTARPGVPTELTFRIVDAHGRTVRAFDVEHTRRMHFIVVRRDLTGFQHLHPRQAADGGWSVPLTLARAGTYRVFADFSVGGTARTLAADLTADGPVRSRDLPAPASGVDVDGLRVTLAEGSVRAGAESELSFTVTRGGRPVAVQPYLGAKGHLVALREGDLAFLHVHPDSRRLTFMAQFPTAGRYRLFLQFRTDGVLHTAAFTQEVS